MAISDTIQSIKNHIEEAYGMAEEKGATIPENKNIQNLADCVGSITGGGGDISEYINSTIPESSSDISAGWFNILKKLPTDLTFSGKNSQYQFYACKIASKLDFSKYVNYNFSNVTSPAHMFDNSSFTEIDMSALDMRKCTTFSYLFTTCKNLEKVTFNNETPALTNMGYMFYNDSKLQEIDIQNLDTNNIATYTYAFYNCSSLRRIDFSKLKTNNCTNFNNMFYNCKKIENFDLSSFVTTKVSNFANMFNNCDFEEIDISNFDFNALAITSSTSGGLSSMFANCSNLKNVIFKTQNINNQSSIANMFNNCINLEELDLRALTMKPSNIATMFNGCTNLKKLDIRNMQFSQISVASNYSNVFGSSATNYVPADCLIIVKNTTEKNWLQNKFARMTNIKTADEYIAEGGE